MKLTAASAFHDFNSDEIALEMLKVTLFHAKVNGISLSISVFF